MTAETIVVDDKFMAQPDAVEQLKAFSARWFEVIAFEMGDFVVLQGNSEERFEAECAAARRGYAA
jgi:hypothetical protein